MYLKTVLRAGIKEGSPKAKQWCESASVITSPGIDTLICGAATAAFRTPYRPGHFTLSYASTNSKPREKWEVIISQFVTFSLSWPQQCERRWGGAHGLELARSSGPPVPGPSLASFPPRGPQEGSDGMWLSSRDSSVPCCFRPLPISLTAGADPGEFWGGYRKLFAYAYRRKRGALPALQAALYGLQGFGDERGRPPPLRDPHLP